MAGKMKTMVPDATGNMREAIGEIMDVIESKEPWSEYLLEDGNRIRTKQAIVNILKLDQMNPDGTPVYVMQSQSVMSVIPKI